MPPPNPLLPTENVKGVTPGRLNASFNVTPTGSATYRIALWVPPGRANMQPSVSFQYDSVRGNDLLGVGWSVAAGSSIVRTRRDHFHDGVAEPVGFTDADPFALDGQRLVLVAGVHGQDGAEYRTKQNTFRRIVLHRPDGLGPTSFTVFTKDGQILTYGPDDASRITGSRVAMAVPASGENQVAGWTVQDDLNGIVPSFNEKVRYGWLLSEARDRAGNTVIFSWFDYQNQNPPGFYGQPSTAKLLREILYTGTRRTIPRRRRVYKAQRRVVFNYEQRPDVRDEFISGLRLWHPARLNSVEMYGPAPTTPGLLRRYSMDYAVGSTGRSLLTAVTESDANGVSKRPHVFQYESNVPEFDDIDTGITDIRTTPGGRSGLPGRLYVMDIDGDGRDDIFYASATRVGFYSFRLSRTGADGRPCLSAEYPTNIPLAARLDRPMPFDFNLDGRTDLLTFDDRGDIGGGFGSQYLYCQATNDPNTGAYTLAPMTAISADIAELSDFDGDGRTDILISPYNDNGTPIRQWSYALNQTGAFGPFTTLPQVGPDDHRFVDIDGDGAVELLTCLGYLGGPAPVPGAWYSALRLGRPGPIVPVVTTLRQDQSEYVFVDLNGDGLLDAVWAGTSTNDPPSVVLNSGNGYFPPVAQPFGNLAFYPDPASGGPVVRAIDYDLDGRKEVVIRYNSAFAPDPVVVVDWNGKTFAPPVVLSIGSVVSQPEEAQVFEVLDLTGNGLEDMVMYNRGSLHLYVRRGNKPDLLKRIADGYGAATLIEYKPTSDPSVYTRGMQADAYPMQRHRSKRWVVSSHSEDDGVGGVNEYQHRYADGRTDLRLPAFVGFATYVRTHVQTGETYEALFDVTSHGNAGPFALAGLPILDWTSTPMPSGVIHQVIRETDYQVRYDSTGLSYHPVATTIHTKEGMLEGATFHQIRRVTTTRDVDEFGNEILSVDKWDTGRQTRVVTQYANQPADWLISLPSLRTVEDTTPAGVTSTRTTAYEYDALGLLSRRIVEPGALVGSHWQSLPPQADGVSTLFTTFTRDTTGQVTVATAHDTLVPGASARTTTFTYDASEGIDIIQTINPVGHVQSVTWHSGLGIPTLGVDANGFQVVFTYDFFGRLRQEQQPGGILVSVNYLDGALAPLTMSVERSDGLKQRFQYDVLGRPVQLSTWSRDDGREVRQTQQFDGLGRVINSSMPYFPGQPAHYFYYRYDPLDRLIVAYLPDGNSWKIGYGDSTPPYQPGDLRRTQVLSPRGTMRKIYEDESGRVVTGRDFDGAASVASQIRYDPFDAPAAVGGPGSPPIHLTSDRFGRTIKLVDPDAGTRTVGYNAFGDVVESSDANGGSQFQYDLLGRLIQQTTPDGVATLTWDTSSNGKGKLAQMTSAFGVITAFDYDNAGRTAAQTWKLPSHSFKFRYGYDGFGRLATMTYPKVPGYPPLTVSYDYGNYGQLISVRNEATRYPFWQLTNSDATGRFSTWELGNGVTERWVESKRPGYLGRIFAKLGGHLIQNLVFGFDAGGNLEQRKDTVSKTSETFGYDGYDRLTQWTVAGTGAPVTVNYDYQPNWNLWRRRQGAGAEHFLSIPGQAGPHAVVKTNQGDCLYDGKGNQIHAPGRDVVFTNFDLPSQITAGGAVRSFLYDGSDARVLKKSPTGSHEVLTIAGLYERRRTPQGVEYRYNVPLPGAAGAQLIMPTPAGNPPAVEPCYLHLDHLGSLRAVTQGTQVIDRLAYDPFGRRGKPASPDKPGAPPTSGITLGFAGHEHDDECGLINMRGRVYDPIPGRFLTPDPIIAGVARPASLNPYAYASNNPQTFTDPSGFDTDEGDEGDESEKKKSDLIEGGTVNEFEDEVVESDILNGPLGKSDYVFDDDEVEGATTYQFDDEVVEGATVYQYGDEIIVSDILSSSNVPAGSDTGADSTLGSPDAAVTYVDVSEQDLQPEDIVHVSSSASDLRTMVATMGDLSNVLSSIGVGGDAGNLLAGLSMLAIRARWIGGGIGLSNAAGKVSSILGEGSTIARITGGLPLGTALGVVGKVGSGLGVVAGAAKAITATNRADRVQAVIDGMVSAAGIFPPTALVAGPASGLYSLTQIVDQKAGWSDSLANWWAGVTPDGPTRTSVGNWFGNHLGL